MRIHSKKVVTLEGVIDAIIDVNEEGKIQAIIPNNGTQVDLDYGDYMIMPGIIDTHNHGCAGYEFETVDEEGLAHCLKAQAARGVTTIFPTTTNYNQYCLFNKFIKMDNDGARIGGIHSEGPWGSRVGEKGVNTGYPEVDLEEVKKYIELGEGQLKLFDIAPEVPRALDAIDYLVDHGVTVSAFHTNATYEEANRGIDHGITVATHLFNVMTGLHHRNVGTAGASILRDEVYCELICDGLHVSLPMVELALRMKNHNQIMMISDNVAFAGAPVGKYNGVLFGETEDSDRSELHVTEEGYVLSKTGRLTGSGLPVMFGVKNLVQKLHMNIEEVVKMSSANAARKYGLNTKGTLSMNKDFDAVVVDEDFNVQATFVEGRKVYDKDIEEIPFNPEFIKLYKLD